MLTKETLEYQGELRKVLRSRLKGVQSEFQVRDIEHARAMLARALASVVVGEALYQQLAFYANGDK